MGFSCSLSHKKRKPIRSAAAPFWHPRHQKTDGVPCSGSNGTGCPLLQTCSELAVRRGAGWPQYATMAGQGNPQGAQSDSFQQLVLDKAASLVSLATRLRVMWVKK